MKYNVKARCDTIELIEDFGFPHKMTGFYGPIHELSDEQVILAIIKHGRAEIKHIDNKDINLIIRNICFENTYD